MALLRVFVRFARFYFVLWQNVPKYKNNALDAKFTIKTCVYHAFFVILRKFNKKNNKIMARPKKSEQAAKAAEKDVKKQTEQQEVESNEQQEVESNEQPAEDQNNLDGKTCADCKRGKSVEYHGLASVRCPLRPFLQRAWQQACEDCQL